ncbi:trypsin-like serine protease [Arthrobacter sp. NPDC093139]|uniref:S1 family peptidase n=1 Tax=Arthrobacter sp. NPDC093139 TaxID=3363945 RepID=UPI0038116448
MTWSGAGAAAGRGFGRQAVALGVAVMAVFGSTAVSMPAFAAVESPTPAVTSGVSKPGVVGPGSDGPGGAGPGSAGPAEGGLAEAVARDLGMTLAEFNAAGAQGKRAADALSSLRKLPGFLTVRLHAGRILVEGSGAELPKAVAGINAADEAGRNEFVLVAPGIKPPPTRQAPKPVATEPAPPAEARPAEGASEKDLKASSVEQLYQAYLRHVGPTGLQSVAVAGGTFIIRTGGDNSPENAGQTGGQPAGEAAVPGEASMSPSEFVARYANVVLEKGAPLVSEEDFLGGQGYRIDGGGVVCSAGFSAFSPAGEPLVLTAGHCADDGAARLAEVTLPAGEPAGGSVADSGVTGVLGTFGFSQFGGPGNSRITGGVENPGEPGKDIAVIESIRADLNLLPAATKWEDPANLVAASVPVIGTAAPMVGQAVCRSGRTEGWSCGTVDEVGIYVVRGPSGEPDDLRSFNGFLSTSVQSRGGDSGGPWISGNYAVGTHSAGNPRTSAQNFAVAATLQDSLTAVPGIQLRLFLNQPVLSGSLPAGPIAAGQRISGRIPAAPAAHVPAGSGVRITVPGQEPVDVPVDPAGNWSFTVPVPMTQFSAQTLNGFSRSGISTFRTAAKPAEPAPGPSSPAATAGPDGFKPTVPKPAPARPVTPALLTPAPEPSVVAVKPAGGITSWERPSAAVGLAATGASGLLPAAGIAGAALILGCWLLVAAIRRAKR